MSNVIGALINGYRCESQATSDQQLCTVDAFKAIDDRGKVTALEPTDVEKYDKRRDKRDRECKEEHNEQADR